MTEQKKIWLARRIVKLTTVIMMLCIPLPFITKTITSFVILTLHLIVYVVLMIYIRKKIGYLKELLWAQRAKECPTYQKSHEENTL